MGQELIQKLMGYIETASPELWRIALQQVDVIIFQSGFWMVIFGLTSILGVVMIVFALREGDESELAEISFPSGFLLFLIGVVGLVYNLINFVSYRINPEYYAIEVIMNLAKQ